MVPVGVYLPIEGNHHFGESLSGDCLRAPGQQSTRQHCQLYHVASPPSLLAVLGAVSIRFEFAHQLMECPGQPRDSLFDSGLRQRCEAEQEISIAVLEIIRVSNVSIAQCVDANLMLEH
jgi:hypothetical protein